MSKQDLRDEYRRWKEPADQARIRGLRRQMRAAAEGGHLARVRVVTNPTHYAVALSFDSRP